MEYDGIYFSEVTHRIFEATRKGSSMLIKYADDSSPKTKKISIGVFELQLQIDLYESLISYEE